MFVIEVDQIIHSGILSAVFARWEWSTGKPGARIVTLLNYRFQSPLQLCQSSSRQRSQYNVYTTIRPPFLFSNLNSLFLILLTSWGWRLARRNRTKERTDKVELVLAVKRKLNGTEEKYRVHSRDSNLRRSERH